MFRGDLRLDVAKEVITAMQNPWITGEPIRICLDVLGSMNGRITRTRMGRSDQYATGEEERQHDRWLQILNAWCKPDT
jgi:hypothetical protein